MPALLTILALLSCHPEVPAEVAMAAPVVEGVLVEGVPHLEQEPDFCGEACVAMWAASLGHPAWDQQAVFDATGLSAAEARGAWTPDLVRAVEAMGMDPGPTWYRVPPGDEAAIQAHLDAMVADLERGVPSIVCMRWSDRPGAAEHFRLVVGYDRAADEVVYHDPALADGAFDRLASADFRRLWPLKYGDDWTLVRLRLEGDIVAIPPRTGPTEADLAQRVMALRRSAPDGYTVVASAPWVVVGNEAPEVLDRRVQGTVRFATSRLEADFFDRRPAEVWTVWLHADAASYERHTLRTFGHRPTTPYGYARDEMLIMDISTGGGTLIHEMVHPYLRANFPEVPAWFNEGLASLYEQCTDRDGHIAGLTNWRLAGLQQAIRAEDVPSFQALMATTDAQFYGPGAGVHYAQSRYLCYWLQEHDLLQRYYREFLANHQADPTGFDTLVRLVEAEDMGAWQTGWERWVLELTFP